MLTPILKTEQSLPVELLLLSALGLLGTLAFFLTRAIWRYMVDPLDLRRFPAPNILADVTPLWCFIHSVRGVRFKAIDAAHKKYGGIVRIGPDHVSICEPEAVKEIYGHINASKVIKADFYDTLAGEYHNIANARSREEHARKRKYVANSFAQSSIISLEPAIKGNASLLLTKLDGFSTGSAPKPLNINAWLNYFTWDVISAVSIGETFGFLDQGSDKFRGQKKYGRPGEWLTVPATIKSQRAAFHFKVALGQLSKFWYDFWTRILWFSSGKKDVDYFTAVAIGQVRSRLEKEKDPESFKGPPDFFSRLLKERDGSPRNLPFMELVSEAVLFFNAGSDTTASGLTSAVYEIVTHPETKARLVKELDEALDCDTGVASYDQVKNLPYLRACLDETLRLNPPISYGPPRLVIDPQGIDVAGHHFRKGTTLSVPTWSIQHYEKIFRDPDVFKPERWLDSDDEVKDKMQHSFIPFSTGPRSCIGRNLATIEQQMILATLFYRYDIELVDKDFKPQCVEAFNYHPGSLDVKLKLRQVASG